MIVESCEVGIFPDDAAEMEFTGCRIVADSDVAYLSSTSTAKCHNCQVIEIEAVDSICVDVDQCAALIAEGSHFENVQIHLEGTRSSAEVVGSQLTMPGAEHASAALEVLEKGALTLASCIVEGLEWV